jgi:hypothetical protein
MKRDYGFVVQRRDGRIETFQTQPKYWGGLMISRAIAIDIQSGDILKC